VVRGWAIGLVQAAAVGFGDADIEEKRSVGVVFNKGAGLVGTLSGGGVVGGGQVEAVAQFTPPVVLDHMLDAAQRRLVAGLVEQVDKRLRVVFQAMAAVSESKHTDGVR
jgi:hypothetical protein